MALIRSISGIRGTIGGRTGEGLSPSEIVNTVSAFSTLLKEASDAKGGRVVIGRDARLSGPMLRDLVTGTLRACGLDVLDLGLSTTPSVEMAVMKDDEAAGGIVLTASHNPMEWNALKFLDGNGEFISPDRGAELIRLAESGDFLYSPYDDLGDLELRDGGSDHIDSILGLELVDKGSIGKSSLKVVVDGVNSTGGIYVPRLLEALGIEDIVRLNCEADGRFTHDPEPLPEHLRELSEKVVEEGADLGIVVDPDVDRLAFIDENGAPFGEEYTLVAVADLVLAHRKGPTVSNLSSSRALKDVTDKHGCEHHASAVGEVHVVRKMKEVGAVIGGEGNGGVILPELHYGRDALVGIALFLTRLVQEGISCSELRKQYPDYSMAKEKLQLSGEDDVDALLEKVAAHYQAYPLNREDGVKVDFEEEWVHFRRSNTEPIVRVYTESRDPDRARNLAKEAVQELEALLESARSIQNG
jgi:phosphomannomutase